MSSDRRLKTRLGEVPLQLFSLFFSEIGRHGHDHGLGRVLSSQNPCKPFHASSRLARQIVPGRRTPGSPRRASGSTERIFPFVEGSMPSSGRFVELAERHSGAALERKAVGKGRFRGEIGAVESSESGTANADSSHARREPDVPFYGVPQNGVVRPDAFAIDQHVDDCTVDDHLEIEEGLGPSEVNRSCAHGARKCVVSLEEPVQPPGNRFEFGFFFALTDRVHEVARVDLEAQIAIAPRVTEDDARRNVRRREADLSLDRVGPGKQPLGGSTERVALVSLAIELPGSFTWSLAADVGDRRTPSRTTGSRRGVPRCP